MGTIFYTLVTVAVTTDDSNSNNNNKNINNKFRTVCDAT